MRQAGQEPLSALPLIAIAVLATGCGDPSPGPIRAVAIQPIFIAGAEADREDVDRFFDCLLHGSNFASYWNGEIALRALPSVVTSASDSIAIEDVGPFVTPLVRSGAVSPAPVGETPVYLVYGRAADLRLSECGRFDVQTVAGARSGVALIRTSPSCWPGTAPLRNETQVGEHELAEAVDALLGYAGCAGDGACNGENGAATCESFTGLVCPGAPAATPTGCGSTAVEGYVVQRLGHAGRDPAQCNRLFTCDFTVEARP